MTSEWAQDDKRMGSGWQSRGRAGGWIPVCALFNFYNRWIDATGVHEMPAEAHRMGGKRLAEHGYMMTREEMK